MDISPDYNVKILKNINNPIMFLGYPLKLAYMYIFSVILGFFIGLALSTYNISLIFKFTIPFLVIGTGIGLVYSFFKKYGVNGFYLEQLDKSMEDQIIGDVSFQELMKNKRLKRQK